MCLWLRRLYKFGLSTISDITCYYKYGVVNIANIATPKKNQTKAEESTILLNYAGKKKKTVTVCCTSLWSGH